MNNTPWYETAEYKAEKAVADEDKRRRGLIAPAPGVVTDSSSARPLNYLEEQELQRTIREQQRREIAEYTLQQTTIALTQAVRDYVDQSGDVGVHREDAKANVLKLVHKTLGTL